MKEVTIIDGGTGTEISRRGVPIYPALSWSANANIAFPDLVRDIHADYIRAGAKIITTNTFSTSRATLAIDGLDTQTAEINQLSVKLAMEARELCSAQNTVLIAGSISAFEPKGHPEILPSYRDALDDYQEQVQLLIDAGVDLIFMEMFTRTLDLKAAIKALNPTEIPVWVGLSCEDFGGHLYLGLAGRHASETIEDAVHATLSPNVEAYCIMHSPPEITADALKELRNCTDLPLGAYSHGGDPSTNQTDHAGTDPQKYLEYSRDWIASGATILGGCCGITPEHIRILSSNYA